MWGPGFFYLERFHLKTCWLAWALCAIAVGLASTGGWADEPGWLELFNGRNLEGWVLEGHADSEQHADGRPVWSVEDGQILCDGREFGFLRYAPRTFADFTLQLEFKMGSPTQRKKCNTGLGIRTAVFDPLRSRATRPSIYGYEIQLLDDAGEPATTHSSGSLYRHVAPAENAIRPAGEWNRMEITCHGPQIRVVLNGKQIQDYDQSTSAETRTKPLEGFVALQNHGGKVWFRNLRIREETVANVATAQLDAQAALLRQPGARQGIRGVLRFALEAVGNDYAPAAVEEALELARSMQETAADDPDFGNFHWRNGDAKVTDKNAVEFAMQLAGLLRVEHAAKLTPRSLEVLDLMQRDALQALRRHDVKLGYTNICLMKIWNLLSIGRVQGEEIEREGETLWAEWLAFTRGRGITEYLSPTYYGIDLDSLALIAKHARSDRVRVEAEAALEFFWTGMAAHWFAPAERLSGPHSRDYDTLYGRGYLDDHLAEAGWLTREPVSEGAGWLQPAQRSRLLVFRSACRWIPPPTQLEEMQAEIPRFVVERAGEKPWQRLTNHIGSTLSVGIAGESRGAEDKALLINLPGDSRTANVTLLFDGRGDPYGIKKNPVGSAGHHKAQHLKPFLTASQDGSRITAGWLFDPFLPAFKVEPEKLALLEAHLLLPVACAVWTTEAPVAPGTDLPPDAVVFLRQAEAVVGVRFLVGASLPLAAEKLRLEADGEAVRAQRLTATFSSGRPQRGGLLALDIEAREGCNEAAFVAFRREFSARKVTAGMQGTRFSVAGSLPLEFDTATLERLQFEPRLPAEALLIVNGREIGRDELVPAPPR